MKTRWDTDLEILRRCDLMQQSTITDVSYLFIWPAIVCLKNMRYLVKTVVEQSHKDTLRGKFQRV